MLSFQVRMVHLELTRYLARIGYPDPLHMIQPNKETLFRLHRHHITSIPFDNTLVYRSGREPVEWSLPAVYQRVVNERQGEVCVGHSVLFRWAATQLGF